MASYTYIATLTWVNILSNKSNSYLMDKWMARKNFELKQISTPVIHTLFFTSRFKLFTLLG